MLESLLQAPNRTSAFNDEPIPLEPWETSRISEYPTVLEWFDALYHHFRGYDLPLTQVLDKIQGVKEKYGKPDEAYMNAHFCTLALRHKYPELNFRFKAEVVIDGWESCIEWPEGTEDYTPPPYPKYEEMEAFVLDYRKYLKKTSMQARLISLADKMTAGLHKGMTKLEVLSLTKKADEAREKINNNTELPDSDLLVKEAKKRNIPLDSIVISAGTLANQYGEVVIAEKAAVSQIWLEIEALSFEAMAAYDKALEARVHAVFQEKLEII